MKAAYFETLGGPDVVEVGQLSDPTPGEGEVLLEIRASGLNHLDLWVRRGLPGLDVELPHIGGSDAAGVVAALGPGVDGWQVGDRVAVNPALWCGRDDCEWCARGEHPLCPEFRIWGEHVRGGMAELAVAPAANLYRIPESLSFEAAAVAPLVYQTAWRALMTRAALEPGETVLVTGASGGVSTAAIQIAVRQGATVFAVTSGPENVERVAALGAHLVIDRLEEDFSKRVWAETGRRGVDVVLDSVGEATWKGCVRALAKLGRMVVYGATTGPEGSIDIRRLFWNQAAILGSTMGTRSDFETVMDLVAAGELEPVIDDVWPLERAREAHERLEAGGVFGKLVLAPGTG
ncbi:MAG: zinc-binding dehydrogenase [Gemmatimonadota bacterium]|nr:zinc-binding dehydrogenase [Gemmatimonadota bacterium]